MRIVRNLIKMSKRVKDRLIYPCVKRTVIVNKEQKKSAKMPDWLKDA